MKFIKYENNDTLKTIGINKVSTPLDYRVVETVNDILKQVLETGDQAVIELTRKFDQNQIENIKVSENEITEAYETINPSLVPIFEEAKANIESFHRCQINEGFTKKVGMNSYIGQVCRPLDRVGIYVPGGTAAYPSSVFMNTIPALIAGVDSICICTPADSMGKVNPYVLVAANMLGIDEIYKIGGAQAIAAMAYGTDTIQQVNKIVGPGNAYVAEAKKQVFGTVDIDMIAGPSELLVIADAQANPRYIASDLIAQAEHDKNARLFLTTTEATLYDRVLSEIDQQIQERSRASIIKAALASNSYCILADTLEACISISNAIAPEHLELQIDDPMDYLDKITNAGSIFIGAYSPEALGDYFAGVNHTLPTGGTAKFSSPLGVYDFYKSPSFIYFDKNDLKTIYKKVNTFAQIEGLDGHGNSVKVRFENE